MVYRAVGHQCINHVMNADDICHLAPGTLGSQKAFRNVLWFQLRKLFLALRNLYMLFLDPKDISYSVYLWICIGNS